MAKEKLAAIVADGKMLDDKIGYLAISEFTGLTSEQFQKAYQSLQDQGMERLIIDLRGNPGGPRDGSLRHPAPDPAGGTHRVYRG